MPAGCNRRNRRAPADLRGYGLRPRGRPARPEDPMRLLSDVLERHLYQTCRDEDCQRFACRVYREGFEAGHAAGFAAGYSAGYSAGYADGYADGASEAQ